MNNEIRIRNSLARNPGAPAYQIATNLKVPTAEVKAVMAQGKPAVALPERTVSKPIKLLRAEFDDIGKVKAYMAALPRSEYVDDVDLRRELQIPEPRWREVRDHAAVANFQFVLPNRKLVWMHKEAQDQLRAAIDISSPTSARQ